MMVRVSVYSFSYKRGLPVDPAGNGGGFVFDCRALPNPFWDESLRSFTGRDELVRAFFEKCRSEVDEFLKSIGSLVENSVRSYLKDGRTDLFVAFGCTGGQHRSVYCAERFAHELRATGICTVELIHAAQPFWKTEA